MKHMKLNSLLQTQLGKDTFDSRPSSTLHYFDDRIPCPKREYVPSRHTFSIGPYVKRRSHNILNTINTVLMTIAHSPVSIVVNVCPNVATVTISAV